MFFIAKLNLLFLYVQLTLTIDVINQSLSEVKAAICDDNGNNKYIFLTA